MLMMFDQFVSVLDGAATDGDLTRQRLKNDAINHISATDAWLKNTFITRMAPEVYNFIFGAHASQAAVRDHIGAEMARAFATAHVFFFESLLVIITI